MAENGTGAVQSTDDIIIAQFAITPDGRLKVLISDGIDDRIAFCISAVNLLTSIAAEDLASRRNQQQAAGQTLKKALRVLPGGRLNTRAEERHK